MYIYTPKYFLSMPLGRARKRQLCILHLKSNVQHYCKLQCTQLFLLILTVKFRVVVTNSDLLPHNGSVSYKLTDPDENIILQKKKAVLVNGIAGSEFTLGRYSTLGIWKISFECEVGFQFDPENWNNGCSLDHHWAQYYL